MTTTGMSSFVTGAVIVISLAFSPVANGQDNDGCSGLTEIDCQIIGSLIDRIAGARTDAVGHLMGFGHTLCDNGFHKFGRVLMRQARARTQNGYPSEISITSIEASIDGCEPPQIDVARHSMCRDFTFVSCQDSSATFETAGSISVFSCARSPDGSGAICNDRNTAGAGTFFLEDVSTLFRLANIPENRWETISENIKPLEQSTELNFLNSSPGIPMGNWNGIEDNTAESRHDTAWPTHNTGDNITPNFSHGGFEYFIGSGNSQ